MTSEAMLAGLIGQANAEGASLVTLRALVEEASQAGAARTLARVGLTGEGAAKDLGELRELLGAWRDAKTAARRAAVSWLCRGQGEGILAVCTEPGWQADFLPVGGLSIDGEQLFGVPRSSVMEPVGGSVIDVEARDCLGELLVYLRLQGILGS